MGKSLKISHLVKQKQYAETERSGTTTIFIGTSSIDMGQLQAEVKTNLDNLYGKELPFYKEMHATAKIITEDLRLLERLFMSLKKVFSEQ